ncbi:hypothetical protein L249_6824 [Ophiocordyceps polyrhachis-furcata BCC 54312]|uniref:Extracellular membrane protein CFEM domain-containing protein n=1 Tax=Ophiocordyceps polyrhachis-furcata BCC 54312 TaxID=1330021 RepID=A0A367LKZ8_9HYPO|nr:hypothetical protein L249_6824 [Ophiocordyceps polyrhachis-furcata BCC 54312]
MRFHSLIAGGVFALAVNAQGSASADSSAPASSTTGETMPSFTQELDPAQSSANACLDRCPAGDANCKAHCITVPSPNERQAKATNECTAKCEQGDGSPAQIKAYSDCVQGCISQNFYTKPSGTPDQHAVGGSGDSSSSSGDGASSSGVGAGASSSGTASGAASTQTDTDESASSASGTATGAASSSTNSGSRAAASSTSHGLAPAVTAAPAAALGLVAMALVL